jgi:hypothetical protein
MEGFEVEQAKGKSRRGWIVTFLVGLVLGVVLAVLGRPYLGERLPDAMGGGRVSVEGPVTAKQRDEERLLLTVVTPAGATLATFRKKVGEIDLLVEVGDTVALALSGYEPFVEDPEITRVAKPDFFPTPELTPPEPTETLPDSAEETDSIIAEPASRWYD